MLMINGLWETNAYMKEHRLDAWLERVGRIPSTASADVLAADLLVAISWPSETVLTVSSTEYINGTPQREVLCLATDRHKLRMIPEGVFAIAETVRDKLLAGVNDVGLLKIFDALSAIADVVQGDMRP